MLFFIHCEIKLFFHRNIFPHHLCSEIMNSLNGSAELRIKELKSNNKRSFFHMPYVWKMYVLLVLKQALKNTSKLLQFFFPLKLCMCNFCIHSHLIQLRYVSLRYLFIYLFAVGPKNSWLLPQIFQAVFLMDNTLLTLFIQIFKIVAVNEMQNNNHFTLRSGKPGYSVSVIW